MGRAEQITRHLKRYDSKLYCKELSEGKLCVFRKSTRLEYYDVDGCVIGFARPAPFFIMALTSNWRLDGDSCEWGIEPVMNRLRANDLHQRNLAEECIRAEEKARESKERDMRNEQEAFLKDFRSQFHKTFSDVNTSSMKKIDRRKKDENKFKRS